METAVQHRSFPAVLEPPQITELAFEVSGRLKQVNLRVGQEVLAGDTLLTIDPADFDLQLAQAEAAFTEADSGLRNARIDADRQAQLFARDVVSSAARDSAQAQLEQAEARTDQARRALELVRASRQDTVLRAPFDGVVNSVGVQDFGAVQSGQPVVTLYADTGIQVRILVSYAVVSDLALGDVAVIIPSDRPDAALEGSITEIARRAPTVSAFPVIITLAETEPWLRSGMAVDVRLDLYAPDGRQGIPLPLDALATQQTPELTDVGDGVHRRASVYVFDPVTSTAQPRDVIVGGIFQDALFVIEGLEAGERVIIAGVSFLYPGQAVRLYQPDEMVVMQ
jgi:RND family efflux transporter MFP subunit